MAKKTKGAREICSRVVAIRQEKGGLVERGWVVTPEAKISLRKRYEELNIEGNELYEEGLKLYRQLMEDANLLRETLCPNTRL